ncbi:hypothetical protein ES703_117454 [subsurface metagenome]
MPIYDLICPECGEKTEVILAMKAELPLCPHCNISMKRSTGSLAFWRFKGAIDGETPGAKKYGAEITKKTRR